MGPHWLTGETPASEARITLSPRVAEAGSHLNRHGRGRTLSPPRAPLGPAAALPSSRTSGPTEGHSLSLCLSLCCTHEVGHLAHGCEGNKALHGDRLLEIGGNPKCWELGAVSPGLAVEDPATKKPVPPPGFPGPGAKLARCLLQSSDVKSSPHSRFTPPILS